MANKTTVSNPSTLTNMYGPSTVQTTFGPLNISGSNSGNTWTSNAYSPPDKVVSGPAVHMLWSSFRFDAKEWKPGTVARLFLTSRGHAGQGHPAPMTDYDTNILWGGKLPISVDVKAVSWELKRARPNGPLEELSQTAEEQPARPDESLMGLVAAASIALEATQTIFCQTLLSHDLPKGTFPWKGIEDWRGGVTYSNRFFNIPAGCSFAVRVDFLDTWRPIYPVTLRVMLEMV